MSRTLAPFGRRRCEVARVERVGAYTVLVVADPDGPPPTAGQFSMLATVERWGGGADERPFVPRAFSVMRWGDDEAHYLLEDVGPGTERLCALRAGEEVWVLGPLGEGFMLPDEPGGEPRGRSILVGGGVGIAPLAILQDELLARGRPHALLLGFRDGEHVEGANLLRCARIATDDGSLGHHGLVTDLLVEAFDEEPAGTVYACGPPPMLEAIRALCDARGVTAQLALEATMACGYGACFGCVVPLAGGGYARVCVDGPVFEAAALAPIPAHEVTA
jgi:dihydroorotate dehydrogenase electron transfer subunit